MDGSDGRTRAEVGTDQLLTVAEVAQYLRVKPWTIYTWAEQGRIPAVKLAGRRWRFRRRLIDRWLDHHSNQK